MASKQRHHGGHDPAGRHHPAHPGHSAHRHVHGHVNHPHHATSGGHSRAAMHHPAHPRGAGVGHYGKDHPENFLHGALEGDIHGGHSDVHGFQNSMTSNELEHFHVSRPNQSILTPYALDNVGRVYDRFATSMRDMHTIHGGPENLEHSLSGSHAPGPEDDGNAGPVHKTIFPDH